MDEYKIKNLINIYVSEQRDALLRFPINNISNAIQLVWEAYLGNKTIFACGNGGNSGSIDNFMTDLSNHTFVTDDKTKSLPKNISRLRTINLNSSPSTLTANMNDFGSEYIFSQQLISNCIDEGDVVFGYSGSGNSKNIINTFEVAKEYGAKTIAVTKNLEGRITKIADVPIVFAFDKSSQFPGQKFGNDNNFYYEDFGFGLGHIITGILRQKICEYYNIK